jgi:hypothetical protein
MNDRIYHELPRLSASGAKVLLKSPARYKYEREHPPKPTSAMEFGTMLHCLVLQPELFEQQYALAPAIDRRTKEGKAAAEQWAADNQGKAAVSTDDWDRAHRMADAVEMWGASDLMVGGEMEKPILWERDGVPLKAKLDCLTAERIVDLKTTSADDEDSLVRAAWQYGYHISAAAYQEAAEVATGKRLPKVFVFVCNQPPHDVVVLEASDEFLERGRHAWNKAVHLYGCCHHFDDWPGMSDFLSGNKLNPPRWA